ncbi:MAG: hypothetical protein QOD85_1271 [Gaiellaceae bacterium]|nr:hypothetical protein [Gaiellaceae bacterium]
MRPQAVTMCASQQPARFRRPHLPADRAPAEPTTTCAPAQLTFPRPIRGDPQTAPSGSPRAPDSRAGTGFDEHAAGLGRPRVRVRTAPISQQGLLQRGMWRLPPRRGPVSCPPTQQARRTGRARSLQRPCRRQPPTKQSSGRSTPPERSRWPVLVAAERFRRAGTVPHPSVRRRPTRRRLPQQQRGRVPPLQAGTRAAART